MSEVSLKDKLSSLLILRRQTIVRLNYKNIPDLRQKDFLFWHSNLRLHFTKKATYRNDSSLPVSVPQIPKKKWNQPRGNKSVMLDLIRENVMFMTFTVQRWQYLTIN